MKPAEPIRARGLPAPLESTLPAYAAFGGGTRWETFTVEYLKPSSDCLGYGWEVACGHGLCKQWIILVAGYGGCVELELELEGLNKSNGFVQQRYGTSKYYKAPDIRAAFKVIQNCNITVSLGRQASKFM